MSLVFHAALALADVVGLTLLARRPGFPGLLAALFATAVAGWVLATILGRHVLESGFAYLRFLALGVAVHGPLVLGVAAWILRREHRRLAWTAAVLALVVAGAAADAFLIEPRWLEVSRHTLTSSKIDEPIRIVVLADYQTDAFGPYERRVWDTAKAQEADLVLLPGDYLQVHDQEERVRLREETREYLRTIRFGEGARLGAFAVVGDVDYQDDAWAELFDGTPVTAVAGTRTLELPELTLTALEVRDSRRAGLTLPSSPRFHVVFGHAPDFALNGVDADLQVAGHTHGGQLRVPGIGPLLTFSRVPRSWAAGVTDLGGGRTLVVSRGVGLERGHAPRLRFLCRPEIVVLDIEPPRSPKPFRDSRNARKNPQSPSETLGNGVEVPKALPRPSETTSRSPKPFRDSRKRPSRSPKPFRGSRQAFGDFLEPSEGLGKPLGISKVLPEASGGS